MVAAWILIITLSLPSFGGPIVITVTTQTKAECEKFRSMVVKQFQELLIPDTGLSKGLEVIP